MRLSLAYVSLALALSNIVYAIPIQEEHVVARDNVDIEERNFWQTVKNDAKKVGHAVENGVNTVSQAVGTASQAVDVAHGAKSLAGNFRKGKRDDLDEDLVARDDTDIEERNFWQTVKNDAKKVGHSIENGVNTVSQAVGTASQAVDAAHGAKSLAGSFRKGKRDDLDEDFVARDDTNIEERNFWQTVKNDAKKVGHAIENGVNTVSQAVGTASQAVDAAHGAKQLAGAFRKGKRNDLDEEDFVARDNVDIEERNF